MPPRVAVMLLFSMERDFPEEVAGDREWYRVGELWRGIATESDASPQQPRSRCGKCRAPGDQEAASDGHGSLDVVMAHLLGRVVRSGYGRLCCHQLALPSSGFFFPAA